ncbi:MAG: dolichol-P-mannose synthesis [Chaenotheca gracillima]|nr:MAG: dolichol-P-mannose synthesis [Chaenotheca gracillima]
MRFNTLSAVALLSSFSVRSSAAPLPEAPPAQREQFHKRGATPYSVVAVDGGSSGSSTQSVTTEVQTITASAKASSTATAAPTSIESQSQPATSTTVVPPEVTTTIISTKVVSDSGSAKTVVVTITNGVAPAPTGPTPKPAEGQSQAPNVVPGYSLPSSTAAYTGGGPSTTASPTGSAGSYDDGQWHSTYPSWNGSALLRRGDAAANAQLPDSLPLEQSSVVAAPTGEGEGATAVRRSVTKPTPNTWNETVVRRGAAGLAGSPPEAAPTAAFPTGLPENAILGRSDSDDSNNAVATISSVAQPTSSSAPLPIIPPAYVLNAGAANPTEVPSMVLPTHEHVERPAEPTKAAVSKSPVVPSKLPLHLLAALAVAEAHAST